MKEDKRELKIFEREFEHYSAAGAIVSYGDVIDFVDGKKGGIFLGDTCGHSEYSGNMLAGFVRKEIEAGWGVRKNAADDLFDLGTKLAALRPPGVEPIDSDEWFDWLSALYAQFDGKNISLSMAGGLGFTYIFRNDKSLEKFLMMGGTLDDRWLTDHDPPYNFSLEGNEVLLLNSDGLVGNIADSIYRDVKAGKMDFDTRFSIEYIDCLLIKHISGNRDKSPEYIRDTLVSELSDLFFRRDLRYDDVTFVVVKRKA